MRIGHVISREAAVPIDVPHGLVIEPFLLPVIANDLTGGFQLFDAGL